MKATAWIAAYFAIAFLTFGHLYNTARICSLSAPSWACDAPVDAMFKGMYWPIYWAGRGAIIITAPETWA